MTISLSTVTLEWLILSINWLIHFTIECNILKLISISELLLLTYLIINTNQTISCSSNRRYDIGKAAFPLLSLQQVHLKC